LPRVVGAPVSTGAAIVLTLYGAFGDRHRLFPQFFDFR
jgi:hypothetical protein